MSPRMILEVTHSFSTPNWSVEPISATYSYYPKRNFSLSPPPNGLRCPSELAWTHYITRGTTRTTFGNFVLRPPEPPENSVLSLWIELSSTSFRGRSRICPIFQPCLPWWYWRSHARFQPQIWSKELICPHVDVSNVPCRCVVTPRQ